MIMVPLTHGKFALIDDTDEQLIKKFKWYPAKQGTRCYVTSGKFSLHRLIMGFPKNNEIDHIDGNGLNCQRCNLRLVSRSQNLYNTRMRIGNKSGFKGVTYKKDGKRNRRYYASITANKKRIYIGHFKTAIEAAKAYNKASLKYHGEFGLRNLI